MTTTEAPVPPPPVPAPQKSSLGKKILKLFVALLVLIVVGLIIVFLNLNTLVRAGVIRGGHYATEQNTDLQAAALALSQGTLQLDGLAIGNPKGYTAPNLLSMKDCSVIVESSSLFSHTVVITDIAIQGLEITLEQNGAKNNLAEIMDIIQKKTAATGDKANASPGKELKIGKLTLAGIKVHVRANVGAPMNLDLDLPTLSMTDPTNPDGRPMKIADLIGKILLLLSKQIVENPQIPGSIKDSMKNVQVLVDNLRGELDNNVKVLSASLQSIQDATKTLDPKALENTIKNIQNSTKGLPDPGKNIGNLLNQKKDPPK